ncbi:hypothetical protein D3C80_1645270 [compost metagenome]
MLRLDVVAFDDVLEQGNQRLDLRFAVGMPDPASRCIGKARVDDLDTDGAGVQPGTALPLAFAGMPGAAAFIHQLIDRTRAVAHQIMAADLAVGEQCQRAIQRGVGVVQDHELDTVVVVDRRVAAVDAQAGRAAGNGHQQQSDEGSFEKREHVWSLDL